MDFTSVPTPTLLETWENLRKGLDRVVESLADGTFHTVGPKGEGSPAEAGCTTLWFLFAVHAELEKRGIIFEEESSAKSEGSRTRRKKVRTRYN